MDRKNVNHNEDKILTDFLFITDKRPTSYRHDGIFRQGFKNSCCNFKDLREIMSIKKKQ